MKSKMKSQRHADKPPLPSILEYSAACKYPENMAPTMPDRTKMLERLLSSLLRYQEPIMYCTPGHAALSKKPMKNYDKSLSACGGSLLST